MLTARALLRQEGILGGRPRARCCCCAALLREQSEPQRSSLSCATAARSTFQDYNDAWMFERASSRASRWATCATSSCAGTTPASHHGTGRRLASHSTTACACGCSQLPVVDEANRIVGIVDEFDLLQVVRQTTRRAVPAVSAAMSRGSRRLRRMPARRAVRGARRRARGDNRRERRFWIDHARGPPERAAHEDAMTDSPTAAFRTRVIHAGQDPTVHRA